MSDSNFDGGLILDKLDLGGPLDPLELYHAIFGQAWSVARYQAHRVVLDGLLARGFVAFELVGENGGRFVLTGHGRRILEYERERLAKLGRGPTIGPARLSGERPPSIFRRLRAWLAERHAMANRRRELPKEA